MVLGTMKFALMVLSIVLALSLASAVCQVTFDRSTNYTLGSTITATMSCSEVAEKNDAYTLNWTNGTGFQIELDLGTTPNSVGTNFFETFLIPDNYTTTNGNNITATLQGGDLEGSDYESISSAGASDLIIVGIGFTNANDIRLGKTLGIEFEVDDENGKSLSNAQCEVDIEDGLGRPLKSKELITHTGKGDVEFILDTETFSEDRGYLVEIRCFCGIANTTKSCIDEDGVQVSSSASEVATTFNILKWLDVTTLTDRSNYYPRNIMFICANVTNNATERKTLHIFHQVRCSAGTDNFYDLDRGLIISDGLDYDERGIGANATQTQCKEFLIPELRHLEGKTSQCYATTTTWVINERNKNIKNYPTTSDVFNITSDSLNLPADWEEVSENIFSSIINLSSSQYMDWNGSGTGDIDVLLDSTSGEMFDPKRGNSFPTTDFSAFILIKNIKNITVYDLAGNLVTSKLEYLEDGRLEIELRGVDISQDGWYNITLEFEDFEERLVEATEGIEDKTGVFFNDVVCDNEGIIEQQIECDIFSYIENNEVEKEVDFTCYIVTDDGSHFSETNWNKMITKTPFTITKSFNIPGSFVEDKQYTVQCHADHYHPSRRDSFYTSFTAKQLRTQVQEEEATGGAGDNFVDKINDAIDTTLGKTRDMLRTISTKIHWTYYLLIAFGLCFFMYGKIRKKRKVKIEYD